jgi:hypothetical protein
LEMVNHLGERNRHFLRASIELKYMNPIAYRVQRDLNPRPTAPQAVILSKLNYGPR